MSTILSTTLLILLMLGMQLPLRSVLSLDDGFFVVPEDEFYDPSDYDVKPSLSSGANTSENFRSKHTLPNENVNITIGSQNLSDYNFAVAGDWGCTKNTARTVELIQNHDPDIVFSLGDTSYGPNINCWTDIVSPISDKIKAVIGNHDVMSPSLLEQHLKEFGLHRPYYSFDYNNIHFLMMDSEMQLPNSHIIKNIYISIIKLLNKKSYYLILF